MQPDQGSIKRDGDFIVIRIPSAEIHGLRVALEECPCKAVKSNATKTIRQRIRDGLARLY